MKVSLQLIYTSTFHDVCPFHNILLTTPVFQWFLYILRFLKCFNKVNFKEKAMSVGEVEYIDFEVDVKNVEQVLDIEDVEIDEVAPDEDEE
jgi:hypothetical protein